MNNIHKDTSTINKENATSSHNNTNDDLEYEDTTLSPIFNTPIDKGVTMYVVFLHIELWLLSVLPFYYHLFSQPLSYLIVGSITSS